jgi:hypothetical protein
LVLSNEDLEGIRRSLAMATLAVALLDDQRL